MDLKGLKPLDQSIVPGGVMADSCPRVTLHTSTAACKVGMSFHRCWHHHNLSSNKVRDVVLSAHADTQSLQVTLAVFKKSSLCLYQKRPWLWQYVLHYLFLLSLQPRWPSVTLRLSLSNSELRPQPFRESWFSILSMPGSVLTSFPVFSSPAHCLVQENWRLQSLCSPSCFQRSWHSRLSVVSNLWTLRQIFSSTKFSQEPWIKLQKKKNL